MYHYDDQNLFAKIIRNEIPNQTVFENDVALAFRDIAPQAPNHILVIPKGPYMSLDHFAQEASSHEQLGFFAAISEVCKLCDIEDGFRGICNTRVHGGQEVPHFHMHLLSGRPLGPMLSTQSTPKIQRLLCISGSLRANASNRMLLKAAAELSHASHIETADLNLPLYDGDFEDTLGIPSAALKLHTQISNADAVLISTPEYNKGISGALKNALDWVSRADQNPWQDKPVAIMSCAAGRAGGERALSMLTQCLTPFQPKLLIGPDILIAQNYEQFDQNGQLTNERYLASLKTLMERLQALAI